MHLFISLIESLTKNNNWNLLL